MRYTSPEMAELFGPLHRARVWRDVWISLARGIHYHGGPVTLAQVESLRATRDQIDLDRIAQIERETRHDVVAHIKAWAEVCPEGAPIIHLGATSCLVTDNADSVIIKSALEMIDVKLVNLIRVLSSLVEQHIDVPTLAYTHFQPAQPTTMGKRFCMWLQDLYMNVLDLEREIAAMMSLGAKGATGTQASYYELFDSAVTAAELDRYLAVDLGLSGPIPVSGQTAPRMLDLRWADVLANMSIALAKMGTDVRLLAHTGELTEFFGEQQVGSSAMPYKRNPMKAERLCSLSRVVRAQREILVETAASQWLERSLDDSAARRLTIPTIFMVADGALRVAIDLVNGLQVHADICKTRLEHEAPFMLVDKLLVTAARKGANRQEVHERLRAYSSLGHSSFICSIAGDAVLGPLFKYELSEIARPEQLVGLAGAQARRFLETRVQPFLVSRRHVPMINTVMTV